MGLKMSSCLVDNCTKEMESIDYSGVMIDNEENSHLVANMNKQPSVSHKFEETPLTMTLHTDWSEESEKGMKLDLNCVKNEKRIQDSQDINSSRSSDSNESVMSVISPTKDKSKRKRYENCTISVNLRS